MDGGSRKPPSNGPDAPTRIETTPADSPEDPTRVSHLPTGKSPPGETFQAGGARPGRLGDFELIREIGRGGMGIVYEARQISLKRRVALKVLPPGLGLTGSAVQRFEREAQAAAKLHHTNIVPVYAIGAEGGCHFYAMELIEGSSLAQILENVQTEKTITLKEQSLTRLFEGGAEDRPPAPDTDPVSPTSLSDTSTTDRRWFDTVARQLADVADALDHAHGRGVIHRDIKPANLLLSPEGRLCITDFGLARVAQEPGMTATGAFLGTPAYMSPEQARGRGVDHRADIYSLGVVLYEMLTLRRPFPGDTWEKIVHAILTREPTAPRRINPRVPLDLETICQKAIEKDPDRRYGSAGALAGDLRQYLQRGLITARRAGPIRRTAKWIRRHPLASVVTAAVVAILLLGGWAWRSSLRQTAEATRRAVADARLAMSEGEYRKSLISIGEALAIDPGLWEARLIRTRLLMELDRIPEAVDEANALYAENPDDWEIHLILAALAKGGWDRMAEVPTISAQEHVEFVEERAPETADAYYLRSLVADLPGEALELLDRALDLYPGHAGALLERVRRFEQMKDYPAATQECERLVAARPWSPLARRTRAWLYRESGDFLGALAEMEEAVRLDPDDPANYDHRAQAKDSLARLEDAIEDITRAIELNPTHAPYYHRRAEYYKGLSRFEQVIADCRRALELDPDYRFCYGTLLDAHIQLGQEAGVREVAAELADAAQNWIAPDARVWTHRVLAYIHQILGEPELALAELDRALEIDPDEFGSLLRRAHIHSILQDEQAHEADCAAAARIILDPAQAPGIRMESKSLGWVCNRWDLAEEGLDRLIADLPTWWQPYESRTEMYISQARLEEALADCNKIIELVPRYWGGYNCRAVVSFKMNRAQGDDLEKAVELNPYDATFRLNLADAFFNEGRLEDSLIQLNRAIELSPNASWPYGMRGRVFALQGRCDEARTELDRAREMGGAELPITEAQVEGIFYGCPDDYDPAAVLETARAYVEAVPIDPAGWNLLGSALYRDGQYREAKEALLKAGEIVGSPSRHDLFLLSMVTFRLGDHAKARSYFDRAVEGMEAGKGGSDPALINYRGEASRLLGVRDPAGATP